MGLKVERLCPAREEDISACLAIYNTYIQNITITFEEEPLLTPAFAARVRKITEQHPFFLAKSGEKVRGYAYLDRYRESGAYRCTGGSLRRMPAGTESPRVFMRESKKPGGQWGCTA